MEMPRSGFAGAVTCTPSACSRSITPFQLEPSAKAPCTRTTVRGAAALVVSSDMRAPYISSLDYSLRTTDHAELGGGNAHDRNAKKAAARNIGLGLGHGGLPSPV